MIIHSTVWIWIPLTISIIKNIRSIICAPPIIVLIRSAWPGQSTNVNCKYLAYVYFSNRNGTYVKNAENPRSIVIPLYWDWGFLSRDAVDITELNILHIDVFPLSTCPNTPILILLQLEGLIWANYYLGMLNSYFYILWFYKVIL